MSGSESDSSIATDEMNELKTNVDDTFEKKKKKDTSKKVKVIDPGLNEVEVETTDPTPDVEEVVKIIKRPKKKVEKVVYVTESSEEDDEEEPPQPIVKKKKKKGRPPMPLEERLAKKVITKEKVIYMIEGQDGTLTKKDPKQISLRELKKLEKEEEAQKKELELGRRLKRMKDGSAKIPKPRSAKQIEATKKMREALEAKKKARKEQGVQEKQVKQEAKEKVLKESVKESIREVVQEPIKPPPRVKSAREEYLDFFS